MILIPSRLPQWLRGVQPLEHATAAQRTEIRAAFIRWLRDPAHQRRQGFGQMFGPEPGRCCTHGALALILADHGYARLTPDGAVVCGVRFSGLLQDPVARALDLPEALLARLTLWNDQGWTFAQIGAALERDLRELHLN